MSPNFHAVSTMLRACDDRRTGTRRSVCWPWVGVLVYVAAALGLAAWGLL